MESLGTRLLKRVAQTDLVSFKNSDQITKQASESVLGASSVANCRTSVANCRNAEVVTFRGAVGMLKEARDRVYQRIVARQLMERVSGDPESDSIQRTKSATVRKTCDTSGSSQEASVDLSPLVKRSLAMVQPDPLRTPPQAPPQPQYPAAQMAQPSMTNSAMSQVGQPMHGASPAVNPHGGPALAGQIGTSGTGLDAPQDTRAAAMPGTPGHKATNFIDSQGGLDPRGMTIDGNNSAGTPKDGLMKGASNLSRAQWQQWVDQWYTMWGEMTKESASTTTMSHAQYASMRKNQTKESASNSRRCHCQTVEETLVCTRSCPMKTASVSRFNRSTQTIDKYASRLAALKARRDPDGISQQPTDISLRISGPDNSNTSPIPQSLLRKSASNPQGPRILDPVVQSPRRAEIMAAVTKIAGARESKGQCFTFDDLNKVGVREIIQSLLRDRQTKQANGDMLAFLSAKAKGKSDKEADDEAKKGPKAKKEPT